MATVADTGLISQVVRQLPAPVLRLLDAWSHRIARRRAQQRIRRWQERLAPAVPEPEIR